MRLALFAGAGLILSACNSPAPEPSAPTAQSPAVPIAPTAAMGAQVFKRCIACHAIEVGAPHGIGPNLHGLVGRAVAAAPGFAYSPALKARGGIWDAAALDGWLRSPGQAAPGNRMAFAGIAEAAEREALILYLAEQR